MSKCSHESCEYWNKERGSCFFFIEGSGEVEDMPCYEEEEDAKFVAREEKYMNAKKICQSCKHYKDEYCEVLELKPHYPEKACDYFSRQNRLKKDAMQRILEAVATNGDVIKAMFGVEEVDMSNTYCVHFPEEEEDYGHYFFKEWWNAPYQKGGKE